MASKWKLFALHLKVDWDFIVLIEEQCLDSSSQFYGHGILKEQGRLKQCLYHLLEEWLYEKEGTGDLPRTWGTIVTALESCRISSLAESLRRQIKLGKCHYCTIGHI